MTYLADIFNEPISGEWGEETEGEGTKVIRTTNFTNSGKLDLSKGIALRSISDKKVAEKRLQYGDVIIEKSGGSPAQPVGRVVFFDIEQATWLCNNFTAVLRPKQEFHPRYCFYLMYCLHKCGAVLKYQNKTTGIINLKLNDYLKKTKVSPLPPLETQKKIAAVLDKAQELIDKRTEQLAKLDEFVQSVFVEMFGDVVVNPKKWPVLKLANVAEVVSGVTKGRKLSSDKLVTIPYMRVANVQDGHLVLDEIKEIEVLPADVEKYRLKFGDLLMTEGGDPDKLGRGAIWKNEIPECIHQNHIFRVRLSQNYLLSEYTCCLVGSAYGKKYFLRAAKQTTGIATINSTQLKAFPVYTPPLDLQTQFAAIVEKTEQQKALMQQSLAQMENNMSSLMQRAFKGELF